MSPDSTVKLSEYKQMHQLFSILKLPAGALVGFAASSSSLLDSSLLELSALVFAFLAEGPLLGGAFRFLDSGDLRRSTVILKLTCHL